MYEFRNYHANGLGALNPAVAQTRCQHVGLIVVRGGIVADVFLQFVAHLVRVVQSPRNRRHGNAEFLGYVLYCYSCLLHGIIDYDANIVIFCLI